MRSVLPIASDRMLAMSPARSSWSKSSILSLSAPVFLVLQSLRFLFADYAVYSSITMTSVVIGFLFLMQVLYWQLLSKKLAGFVCLFIVAGLIAIVTSPSSRLGDVIQFISHLGYAAAFSYGRTGYRLMQVTLIVICASFLLLALKGTNPEGVFTISRNYVSVLVVLAVCLYLIACDMEQRSPSLILMLIVLIVMLWAVGRAGILTALIVILGCVILNRRRVPLLMIILSVTAVVLLFGFVTFQLPDNFSGGIDRFQRMSLDGQRVLINGQYLEAILGDIQSFLFGTDLNRINAIVEVGGNPHNSFINLHVNFGIMGVIVFSALFLYSLWRCVKEKLYYIALAQSALAFRAFFDVAAFSGQLDVGLLSCILVASSSHQTET